MSSAAAELPDGIGPADRVILFDGVCNVCCGWVRFVTKRDPAARLRFASLQSPAGQAILAWCGLRADEFDTMVFVEDGRAHLRSSAFLRVVGHLRRPWPVLRVGLIVPRVVRDWLYDRVAKNRYRLFGKRDTCLMPTPELMERFL